VDDCNLIRTIKTRDTARRWMTFSVSVFTIGLVLAVVTIFGTYSEEGEADDSHPSLGPSRDSLCSSLRWSAVVDSPTRPRCGFAFHSYGYLPSE
jgi:hypothetical protein